jgi:hypothetical protein
MKQEFKVTVEKNKINESRSWCVTVSCGTRSVEFNDTVLTSAMLDGVKFMNDTVFDLLNGGH